MAVPGAALLATALLAQPAPVTPRDQAIAASFITALKEGRLGAARALLAPSVTVRRWGGGEGDQFDRLARDLASCDAPRFTLRPPRSIDNFGDRPLLVAAMTCGEGGNNPMKLRFTIGGNRRIDSVSFGYDWRAALAATPSPPPTGGQRPNAPVTDAERDALIAAVDRGNADALRALVGSRVLRVGPRDEFTGTSPEDMIEALRDCTVFSVERGFTDPDMFYEVACRGRPRGAIEEWEEPGFGLKLWHHPQGGLAVYYQPMPVQVRPRTGPPPLPPPPPRPPPRPNP